MAKLPILQVTALFGLILLFTGCSLQSPAEQQTKELQTVQSWAATAHMVSDAWANNTVPRAYAQRTLETAQQSIQDSLDTLTQAATAPATLLANVRSIAQVVRQMAAAVDRNDRVALQQQTTQLTVQEQTIATLTKREGH